MSQDNPYTSPSTIGAPVGRSEPFRGHADVMAMFRYVTTSPNWIINVLIVTVAQLVPIAGPIVTLGYVFEALEALVRDPQRPFLDFDFNRLGAYLMRGLWPLLVALVASLVIVPIILVFMGIFFFVPMMVLGGGNNDAASALLIFVFFVGALVFAALILVLQTVLLPLNLAAGLTQDFGAAMNFQYVSDFLRRTWKESLLLLVVWGLAAAVLGAIGACVLGVGAYVAAAYCGLAATHMYYQLYSLYLMRGGKPLPLKEPV